MELPVIVQVHPLLFGYRFISYMNNIQGGPGGSSLFGDFLEIGPLDAYLKPRNTTW